MTAPSVYALKPWFVSRLERAEDVLVKREVPPDALSYAAVAVSAVAAAAVAAGRPGWIAVAPLAVVRLALNALDGSVARRRGTSGPAGMVVNEVADRACDIVTIGATALVAPAALVAAAIAAALLTSFTGVLAAAASGVRLTGGPMGKADRALVLGGAFAVAAATGTPGAVVVALWAIVAGGIVTAALRVGTVLRVH